MSLKKRLLRGMWGTRVAKETMELQHTQPPEGNGQGCIQYKIDGHSDARKSCTDNEALLSRVAIDVLTSVACVENKVGNQADRRDEKKDRNHNRLPRRPYLKGLDALADEPTSSDSVIWKAHVYERSHGEYTRDYEHNQECDAKVVAC